MTEGPFFVDERLNRGDLVTGTDRPAVRDALPLALSVAVYKLTAGLAVPLSGVTVDVWHADAHGVYSDEDDAMNNEPTAGQRWLRGYQVTDAAGRVNFATVFPGWYDGRAPHVHFKVRQFAPNATTRPVVDGKPTGATAEFTSQWFFPDAVASAVYAAAPYKARGRQGTVNADDGIYSEELADGSPAGGADDARPPPRPGQRPRPVCRLRPVPDRAVAPRRFPRPRRRAARAGRTAARRRSVRLVKGANIERPTSNVEKGGERVVPAPP